MPWVNAYLPLHASYHHAIHSNVAANVWEGGSTHHALLPMPTFRCKTDKVMVTHPEEQHLDTFWAHAPHSSRCRSPNHPVFYMEWNKNNFTICLVNDRNERWWIDMNIYLYVFMWFTSWSRRTHKHLCGSAWCRSYWGGRLTSRHILSKVES